MAKNVLVSLNLNKNELQNALMHPLAVAPSSPSEAQIYYNSGSKKLFLFNGTVWLDITGAIRTITSTTPSLVIDITDPANPVLSIADADGTNSGLLTSAFFTDLTNATDANNASTIVKRDANGDFSANDITANKVTGLVTPVANSDAVNKQYVDNLLSSGMKIVGAIDCSTNPDYPIAVVGEAYRISVDGLIGGASGEVVSAGDFALCITDSPVGGDQATVGADWMVLQENVDQATDIIIGLARIATQAEVNAGSNADAYVTPATLQAKLAGLGAGTVTKAVATVGDGTNTLFTVNHALNQQYCEVQIFDAVSNEEVIAEVDLFDADNVKITFAVAPTTNQYRVVVLG